MKKMKDLLARGISEGSARYGLRSFYNDLEMRIAEDDYVLEDDEEVFFQIYFDIIRLKAFEYRTDEIIYALKRKALPEEVVRFHIKRIDSNYADLVEILQAIFLAKIRDFIKMGATPDCAMDCFNEWLRSELP
jgi:hypothetical protein